MEALLAGNSFPKVRILERAVKKLQAPTTGADRAKQRSSGQNTWGQRRELPGLLQGSWRGVGDVQSQAPSENNQAGARLGQQWGDWITAIKHPLMGTREMRTKNKGAREWICSQVPSRKITA